MELGCCPHALSQTYSSCFVASQIHQVRRRVISFRMGKLAKLTILAFRFLDGVFFFINIKIQLIRLLLPLKIRLITP